MKIRRIYIVVIAIAFLFAGCATRSISNSGYPERGRYRGGNSQYIGELNELSVLGVNHEAEISEADIQNAFSASESISLAQGDSIVLIQSGARFPDSSMTEKMAAYYDVIPLSGIPDNWRQCVPANFEKKTVPPSLNMKLRLAAARTGVKTIIVYWGILETSNADIVTKTVSWVPIAGSILPDENQQMRINIKGAVIDVASGNWIMINTKSYDDERISARLNREASDQKQVGVLKDKAYGNFIAKLRSRFSI